MMFTVMASLMTNVIYNCNMFIVQATGASDIKLFNFVAKALTK